MYDENSNDDKEVKEHKDVSTNTFPEDDKDKDGDKDGDKDKDADGDKDDKSGGDKEKDDKDPDGDKDGDKDKKDKDEKSYTAKDLKKPKDSLLDDSFMEGTAAEAAEQGLSKDEAQALLETKSLAVSHHETLKANAFLDTVDGWEKDLANHKKYGGDNQEETGVRYNRAIEKFGTPELRKLLVESRYEFHPEILSFFVELDKRSSDDKLESGRVGGGNRKKTDVELFYPDTHGKEETG